MYVALEKIEDKNFEIAQEILTFFPSKNRFENSYLDRHIINTLNILLKDKFSGYRIKLLSELPLGVSLGALGAICASLAKIEGGSQEEIATNASNMSIALQQGRKSPITALAALTEGAYPAVYFQNQKESWIKSLNEIVELSSEPIWPIDFGLIFTGQLVQGTAVISSAQEMIQITTALEAQAKTILGHYKGSFWEDYLAILDHIAKQNLVALKNVLRSDHSGADLELFFNTLNQYQNLLFFLGISTSRSNDIYSTIHKIANNLGGRPGSGCKITGVGRGGEMLFATPYGQFRTEIEKIGRSKNDYSLDYLSWRDGIESRGVLIEQDLENNLYSKFIEKGMYLLTIFDGAKSKKTLAAKKDDFLLGDYDLLLDKESGRIFYKNKKVDSTQILSQKATVEIISKLLFSKDFQILNEDLPSTYAKSRFDLQSKIISPLSKLTGLKFAITGNMYEDFSLKLKDFDLKIAVATKIV